MKKIYTDITHESLAGFQYYIENSEGDPSRLATTIKLGFKLNFILEGQKLVNVQFAYYKNEEFLKADALILIKEGEQWKICGRKKLKKFSKFPQLARLPSRLKPTKLYFLLTGEQSGESLLDEVVRKTRHKNGFDVDKFHLLINKWRKEKDQKKLDYFFFPFK